MSWQNSVALVLVGLYVVLSIAGGSWVQHAFLLWIAWTVFGNGQRARERAQEGGIPPGDTALEQTGHVMAAMFGVSEISDAARQLDREAEEELETYTPLMSDADYNRIAGFLTQRLPFLNLHQLQEPAMRRYIEEHILSGSKLGELELALGGTASGSTAQPRTLMSGTLPADPRLRAAREKNQAQIEALHAAIPVSRTGRHFAFQALERARRQHEPRAKVVPQGLRAGSQQRRLRLKPSPIHHEIAQSRRTMLHTGLRELQALRAPSAKVSRDGRLTGASTELRSLPPRYVR